MASTDVYGIHSSPPKDFAACNMSSSPALPPLADIIYQGPQLLRTESRATPMQGSASASSISAAIFYNSASRPTLGVDTLRTPGLDHYAMQLARADTATTKPKLRKPPAKKTAEGGRIMRTAPRKTAAKKTAVVAGREVVKEPRKSRAKKVDKYNEEAQAPKQAHVRRPRAKKVEEGIGEDGLLNKAPVRKSRAKKDDKESGGKSAVKAAPVRKSRAKKADGDTQTKLAKGKVMKAPAGTEIEKAAKDREMETQPAGFQDYGLDAAVKRRVFWTPPKPTSQSSTTIAASVDLLDREVSRQSPFSGEKKNGFGNLIGQYGFTVSESSMTSKAATNGEMSRKRKLIELVKTNTTAVAIDSPKEKAVKKKPRTITEQATSAYAEKEDAQNEESRSLLQYFSLDTTERIIDGYKVPPKPRSKSVVKGCKKAKKGTINAPILLSPESAIKHVGNQDFVFGTSSQLAREDSPNLLRDLHEAMQASNEIDEYDPFTESILDSDSSNLSKLPRAELSTKRHLWAAGARDAGGDLLNVDMIDLSVSPAVLKTAEMQNEQRSTIAPVYKGPNGVHKAQVAVQKDNWKDIDELIPNPSQKIKPTKTVAEVGPVEAAIKLTLASSTLRGDSPIEKPLTSKAANSKNAKPQIGSALNGPKMPDFSSFTTARLSKEIASYRFKPIKSRDGMITLLEKCWEGKQRSALGVLATSQPIKPSMESTRAEDVLEQHVSEAKEIESAPTAMTPQKRPRGRPRRDSASPSKPRANDSKTDIAMIDVDMSGDVPPSQLRMPKKSLKEPMQSTEDISDFEPQLISSPRRRRASKTKVSPSKLRLSTMASSSSAELPEKESLELTFKHITQAIQCATPSKNPQSPSWHEKILMYDPIVLEDLCVWLNTGALEKVGWDGEVWPGLVKRWCESKSVCCLWKVNLRGRTRARY